jgi:hypothetical protein
MASDQEFPREIGNDIEAATETTGLLSPKCERQTLKQEITALAQHRSLCWSLFSLGWTMGSVGPLLYWIQKFYGVSDYPFISFSRKPILSTHRWGFPTFL